MTALAPGKYSIILHMTKRGLMLKKITLLLHVILSLQVAPLVPANSEGGSMNCDTPELEMVMQEQAKKHIKFSEDYRENVYLDSNKYPTFGWGHLLEGTYKFDHIRDYADWLFDRDFQRAYIDYRKIIDTFQLHHLSCPRRMVLLDMCYNMNFKKVSKFVNSLQMIREERWEDAARNLEQSGWYNQTKSRARRLIKVILTNEYPTIPNRTASGRLI